MRSLIATAMLALIVGANPAKADWQNTHWGMSPTRVRSLVVGASDIPKDQIEGLSTKDCIARIRAPYASGVFTFEATLLFDQKDGLCQVSLQLNDRGSAIQLQHSLEEKYGKPFSSQILGMAGLGTETWHTAQDLIELYLSADFVDLIYNPRIDPNSRGL